MQVCARGLSALGHESIKGSNLILSCHGLWNLLFFLDVGFKATPPCPGPPSGKSNNQQHYCGKGAYLCERDVGYILVPHLLLSVSLWEMFHLNLWGHCMQNNLSFPGTSRM